MIAKIRDTLRADPVLVSTIVTIVVALGARYGLQIDPTIVLAIAGAVLGITNTAARKAVVAPPQMKRISEVQQRRVSALQSRIDILEHSKLDGP